jgi:catechol 2,3-dioxygenase-like lactoylglutathione lyase family enzyme
MTETDTKLGVTHLGNVIIPVQDQDTMLDFYVGKLGFEKRMDMPFGPGDGMRWIEVAPPGGETTIALAPPPESGVPEGGKLTFGFSTDDVDADHAALRERGVEVDEEVMRMGESVPPMFWLSDPEGNRFLIVQRHDG